MDDVTYIIKAVERGDPHAAEELLPLLYRELRILAAQKLSKEPPGQTLQPTALVHEAYLRLIGPESHNWDSRGHFFAAAAEAMRRILIENARRKQNSKHGGDRKKVSLTKVQLESNDFSDPSTLLELDEILEKFSQQDKVKADLVKLRFFAGLTIKQASEVLGISYATAERYWNYARSWLHREMTQ